MAKKKYQLHRNNFPNQVDPSTPLGGWNKILEYGCFEKRDKPDARAVIRMYFQTDSCTVKGKKLPGDLSQFDEKSDEEKEQLLVQLFKEALEIDDNRALQIYKAQSELFFVPNVIQGYFSSRIYEYNDPDPLQISTQRYREFNYDVYLDKNLTRTKFTVNEFSFKLSQERDVPIEGRIEAHYTLSTRIIDGIEYYGYELDYLETDNLYFYKILSNCSLTPLQVEYMLLKNIIANYSAKTDDEKIKKAAANTLLEYVPQANETSERKCQLLRAASHCLLPPVAEKNKEVPEYLTQYIQDNLETSHQHCQSKLDQTKCRRISTKIFGAIVCLIGASVILAGAYAAFITLGITSVPSVYAMILGAKLVGVGWALAMSGVGASIGTPLLAAGTCLAVKKANEHICDSLSYIKKSRPIAR